MHLTSPFSPCCFALLSFIVWASFATSSYISSYLTSQLKCPEIVTENESYLNWIVVFSMTVTAMENKLLTQCPSSWHGGKPPCKVKLLPLYLDCLFSKSWRKKITAALTTHLVTLCNVTPRKWVYLLGINFQSHGQVSEVPNPTECDNKVVYFPNLIGDQSLVPLHPTGDTRKGSFPQL